MQNITIDHDINVLCVNAKTFPDGIMEAFNKLHDIIASNPNRNIYGISRPENGTITYKAAAEELTPGEAAKLHCPAVTLHKGRYISSIIKDYMTDLPGIRKVFNELLAHPGIDPNGYCVEWYFNDKDVNCMVRLKD